MSATAVQLAVDVKGAAAMVGVAPRTWRRLNASGQCPRPLRIGGSVRWRVDEIRQWIEAGAPSRARWEEMKP